MSGLVLTLSLTRDWLEHAAMREALRQIHHECARGFGADLTRIEELSGAVLEFVDGADGEGEGGVESSGGERP